MFSVARVSDVARGPQNLAKTPPSHQMNQTSNINEINECA